MAQSKKTGSNARTKKVDIRFSDDEYSHLLDLCKGEKPSSFLREFAISQKRPKRPDPAIREIRRELSRIGNNLNQIAKKCNETNSAIPALSMFSVIEEMQTQLDELRERL